MKPMYKYDEQDIRSLVEVACGMYIHLIREINKTLLMQIAVILIFGSSTLATLVLYDNLLVASFIFLMGFVIYFIPQEMARKLDSERRDLACALYLLRDCYKYYEDEGMEKHSYWTYCRGSAIVHLYQSKIDTYDRNEEERRIQALRKEGILCKDLKDTFRNITVHRQMGDLWKERTVPSSGTYLVKGEYTA